MSSRKIIERFNEWRQAGEHLVMATVYGTEGSTYSKAGHRIIISSSGDYQGLVSGGCVEGDLAAHAHMVFVTGEARTITYDLREDDAAIWGMGVGCDGVIKILLQRLDATGNYEPFHTIARRQIGPNGGGACVTVIESEDKDLLPGATWINWGSGNLAWQMPEDRMSAIRNQSNTLTNTARPKLLRQPSRGGAFTALHAPIVPIPRLLVLGAGPDAVPLVTMADEIGWLTTVIDHRQLRIDDPAFSVAEHCLCVPLKDFPDDMKFERFDAAVIMSHNLEADRLYLTHLANDSAIRYIGLLGPKARRKMLIETSELDEAALAGRLHGPAGLEIGANSPESIALSIVAEIHRALESEPDHEDDS